MTATCECGAVRTDDDFDHQRGLCWECSERDQHQEQEAAEAAHTDDDGEDS